MNEGYSKQVNSENTRMRAFAVLLISDSLAGAKTNLHSFVRSVICLVLFHVLLVCLKHSQISAILKLRKRIWSSSMTNKWTVSSS